MLAGAGWAVTLRFALAATNEKDPPSPVGVCLSPLSPNLHLMALQILFVGDLHLGRLPRKTHGDSQITHTPAEAWDDCVALAKEKRVSAVVLAGDVVDSTDQIFSSIRPFEMGVKLLEEEDIPVYAVAGNHDKNALHRLRGLNVPFIYLGDGGEWESVVLGRVNGVPVNLVGWSFPQEKVKASPLLTLDQAHVAEGISLGVVHCDRGASDGPYAPVGANEFNEGVAGQLDAWFLGHIHKPDALKGPRPVGYLGSATTLRRKDTGARGPWLVTVEGKGVVECECLPINKVSYEEVVCDLTHIELNSDEDEQIADSILQEVAKGVKNLNLHDRVRSVGVRLNLRGRVSCYRALQSVLRDWEEQGTPLRESGFEYCVAKIIDDTKPGHDLQELSNEPGRLAGLLAKELLLLGDESQESTRQLWRVAQRTEEIHQVGGLPDLDPKELRRMAEHVGNEILTKLLERPSEGES